MYLGFASVLFGTAVMQRRPSSLLVAALFISLTDRADISHRDAELANAGIPVAFHSSAEAELASHEAKSFVLSARGRSANARHSIAAAAAPDSRGLRLLGTFVRLMSEPCRGRREGSSPAALRHHRGR